MCSFAKYIKHKLLKYLPYYKRNLKLALPIVLSQAGQVIVQQVDTMMVGYVGTTDLAAAAFANSIFVIGLVIVMGFTFGITPAVGLAFNNKNNKYLQSLLVNAHVLNISFAILISALLYGISFTFPYMGQNEEVWKLSQPYFFTLIASLLPLIIFFTNKQFAEGIGNTKKAMYVTISSNIINVIFNYILIFGKFGAPELGLLGAGISTLISRIYMAVMFVAIFKYGETFKDYYSSLKLEYIDKIAIRKLFSLGMPIATQIVLEVSAFAFTAVMAGWLGVIPLAANQIATGLSSISFMIVVGIGAATTIRVSHQMSEKDYNGLLMAAKASIHIVLAFMAITASTFLILRGILPRFYTQDEAVIILASQMLIAAAIFQLFDGLQAVMISILRGFGDVKPAMKYSFIAYILINLPVGYFLAFTLEMGLKGLWIGFIVGLAAAAFMFYFRFRKLVKKLGIL